MGELHFSRCTEWPWTWDLPYIEPAPNGAYVVSGPSRAETVGTAATAQEAVAMVLDRIPPGSGPLFVGTREQFAAHQATLDADDQSTIDGLEVPRREETGPLS
jgi:hypothetical protein